MSGVGAITTPMRNPMREWITQEYAARVTAWAEPTDDGMIYEVITSAGEVVRADSLPLLIAVLAKVELPARLPLAA